MQGRMREPAETSATLDSSGSPVVPALLVAIPRQGVAGVGCQGLEPPLLAES